MASNAWICRYITLVARWQHPWNRSEMSSGGDPARVTLWPGYRSPARTVMTEKLAPTTVRTNYGVLRTILAAAVEADLLVRSPRRGIRMPPHKRKDVRFLSPHEFERLADAMPLEYRPMVYVAGVLGLRWSEVAGLRVGRVDLVERRLAVLETLAEIEGRVSFADVKSPASRRIISIPGFISSMLAKHLLRRGRPGPDELVFVGPDGGPLHAGNFRNRVWHPAVVKSELTGLTFHGLRHSAAGLLIALGAPDHVLQERMGHSSSRVTRDVYGHVLPIVDDAVTSEIDRLFSDPSRTDRARNRNGVSVATPFTHSDQGKLQWR